MRPRQKAACALVMAACIWAADAKSGQTSDGDIGYPSPAAAVQALHTKTGVNFSVQNGWTIAADEANETVWSFAPVGHPAYPAAVKRQVVTTPGGLSIRTAILCGGGQAACDKLPSDFRKLDDEMRQRLFPQAHP
jgi:hypothetical protein